MDKINSRVNKIDQEPYKSIKDILMKSIDTSVGSEILSFLVKMIIFKNKLFILKILCVCICAQESLKFN